MNGIWGILFERDIGTFMSLCECIKKYWVFQFHKQGKALKQR